MNVFDFLPEECTKVYLKEGLTYVDCASFRCLGILIFHTSLDHSTQHLYHRQIVFAWHNLGLPLCDLISQVEEIISEYQNDEDFRSNILGNPSPEEFFQSGLNFAHAWLCSFAQLDFVGKANEGNREGLKELLRKIAEIVGKDFDQEEEEEEEEEEEDLVQKYVKKFERRMKAQQQDEDGDDNDENGGFGEEEQEEEDANICELGVSLLEIKLYLQNLDKNEPVIDMPPMIQRPRYARPNSNNAIPYDSSKPFPLRFENPSIISDHFFYTGLVILSKIQYSEYGNLNWMNEELKDKISPHIMQLEEHYEKTSAIINDSLLSAQVSNDLDLRIKVLERWIEVLNTAYNDKNYLFAFEIMETLNKPSILNLKSTWRDVSKDLLFRFEKLKEVISDFKRYSKYKAELKKADVKNTLPFINPWLTEMWLTMTQIPDYKKFPNSEPDEIDTTLSCSKTANKSEVIDSDIEENKGVNFAKQWAYYYSVEYLKQPWGVQCTFLLSEQILDDIENYKPSLNINDEGSLLKTARVVERSAILSPRSPKSPKYHQQQKTLMRTPTSMMSSTFVEWTERVDEKAALLDKQYTNIFQQQNEEEEEEENMSATELKTNNLISPSTSSNGGRKHSSIASKSDQQSQKSTHSKAASISSSKKSQNSQNSQKSKNSIHSSSQKEAKNKKEDEIENEEEEIEKASFLSTSSRKSNHENNSIGHSSKRTGSSHSVHSKRSHKSDINDLSENSNKKEENGNSSGRLNNKNESDQSDQIRKSSSSTARRQKLQKSSAAELSELSESSLK